MEQIILIIENIQYGFLGLGAIVGKGLLGGAAKAAGKGFLGGSVLWCFGT